MRRQLVLKWTQPSPGKFVPAEQIFVSDWIANAIESYDGDRLRGLTKCVEHLRSRIARKALARNDHKEGNAFWQQYRKTRVA